VKNSTACVRTGPVRFPTRQGNTYSRSGLVTQGLPLNRSNVKLWMDVARSNGPHVSCVAKTKVKHWRNDSIVVLRPPRKTTFDTTNSEILKRSVRD